MDQTLLMMLHEADNAENPFNSLKIAHDYVRDQLKDDLLAYVLKWMIKHNKFPEIKVHTKKESIKIVIDKDEIKRNLFTELANNPSLAKNGVDVLLNRRYNQAREEAREKAKNVPVKNIIKTTYVFYFIKIPDCSSIHDLPPQYFEQQYGEKKFGNWDSLLDWMCKCLKSLWYWGEVYDD